MNLQSKTFYSLRSVTINVSSLDVVTNKRSFSNAFSNEEPTSNLKGSHDVHDGCTIFINCILCYLHNNHGVHSNLGHAGLSPLESKSISNQPCCSLHNLEPIKIETVVITKRNQTNDKSISGLFVAKLLYRFFLIKFYLSQLPGGGRGQLNLGVLCEGFQSGLRKSQEISGGLSDEVEGHSADLQTDLDENKTERAR